MSSNEKQNRTCSSTFRRTVAYRHKKALAMCSQTYTNTPRQCRKPSSRPVIMERKRTPVTSEAFHTVPKKSLFPRFVHACVQRKRFVTKGLRSYEDTCTGVSQGRDTHSDIYKQDAVPVLALNAASRHGAPGVPRAESV